MRALTLWVALVFGCINTVRAFDFDATFPVTGYSGNLIWNYPGSNTDMYLAPDYNTAQYHTLYNAQSFVPTAFGDATTVTSAPVADYSQFTVALRGAGTYGFSVLEPGTVAGQSPTNYDLMSILYVSPTSRTPFDPNQPYANLVGLSDDDHLHSANPYTLFYINEDATACVTMTLVYFSWAGVQNSVANIRASGPGTIASNCDALGIIDATTAQGNLPARGAANVIEASPALLDLFSGLSTDQERSNAVSQTLPLLTGGSMVATTSGLTGINRVIQARIEGNRGLSAGESFYGDRHMWVKPFGSWARQDDRDAVPGFKANTTGLALGIDGTVSERWRLGGAFAYARGDINGNSVVAPQAAPSSTCMC
ncbi:MAG: autotransporter domain-containing protein [Burkholderiales bacterium]|nr:autotransporter domain-containing protein [Burkholderiales bacterium]